MLYLSEQASVEVSAMLERADARPTEGLRLAIDKGQFILQLDSPDESDLVIPVGDRVALIVGRDVEAQIGESLLDVEESPDGNRLIIGRILE